MSRKHNFHVINKIVPAEALYGLASYYNTVGKERMTEEKFDLREALKLTALPWMEREDWPTVGWRMWQGRDPAWWASYGWNLDPDVNRLIAAYIGMSRLAAMSADAALEHEGIYRMAKALIHRYARGFYPPMRDGPAMNDRSATSLIMSQWFTDAAGPFTAMPPELGRFLADHCRVEMESYTKSLEAYYPDIYMAFGTARYCNEWWHNYPEDSRQAFMLNAWVIGRDAQWLYERVDVPWMKVGDLFHIEKLAEIVKADIGTEWKK